MEQTKPNQPQSSEDISYILMPQKLGHPVAPPAAAPKVPTVRSKKKKLTYLIAGIVVLVALAGVGYYIFAKQKSEPQKTLPEEALLPKTWLLKYFNKESCDEASVCGDNADPDKDGLSNYDEFKKTRTSLTNPDTDEDGLADGDEYNIYQTDPTDKYTDKRSIALQNNYSDGHQIKNGYDPKTPGLRFTESRNKQIESDTSKFGLHEPTISALIATGSNSTSTESKSVTVFIRDSGFDPDNLTININDSVVWLSRDNAKHKLVSSDLPDLVSAELEMNQTFSFKFDKAGTFEYHDEHTTSLKGTITVK